jgi:hypothetical protein
VVKNAALKKGSILHLDIPLDTEQDGVLRRTVDDFEILETAAKGAKRVLCCLRNLRCNLLVPTSAIKGALKYRWVFERSSGYAGYRCQICATWVYANQPLKCDCI